MIQAHINQRCTDTFIKDIMQKQLWKNLLYGKMNKKTKTLKYEVKNIFIVYCGRLIMHTLINIVKAMHPNSNKLVQDIYPQDNAMVIITIIIIMFLLHSTHKGCTTNVSILVNLFNILIFQPLILTITI